jgi:hypothetical protein
MYRNFRSSNISEVIAKEKVSEGKSLVKQTLEKLFSSRQTQGKIDFSKTFEYEAMMNFRDS